MWPGSLLLVGPLTETLTICPVISVFPKYNYYKCSWKKFVSLLEAFVNNVDHPVARDTTEYSGHTTAYAKARLCGDVVERNTFICSIWWDGDREERCVDNNSSCITSLKPWTECLSLILMERKCFNTCEDSSGLIWLRKFAFGDDDCWVFGALYQWSPS